MWELWLWPFPALLRSGFSRRGRLKPNHGDESRFPEKFCLTHHPRPYTLMSPTLLLSEVFPAPGRLCSSPVPGLALPRTSGSVVLSLLWAEESPESLYPCAPLTVRPGGCSRARRKNRMAHVCLHSPPMGSSRPTKASPLEPRAVPVPSGHTEGAPRSCTYLRCSRNSPLFTLAFL